MSDSELGSAAGASVPKTNRPAVTVVMPFAGDRAEAAEAAATLSSLEVGPGDELILVDNSGTVEADRTGADRSSPSGVEVFPGMRVVCATSERSPAHARNAGATAASGEWILFVDADCRPRPDLLDAYFAGQIEKTVGALAGEVLAVSEPAGTASRPLGTHHSDEAPPGNAAAGPAPAREPPLAARYGAAKGFLSQRQHLAHPYRPRAVAANLLVRRAAFEQVGGFYEGLRAAEDADFTWRLQQAGWRLQLRPEAWVEHRYRASLTELRRQWRGYAAGRAWLARRYQGFIPEPALSRALGRMRRRLSIRRPPRAPTPPLARVCTREPITDQRPASEGARRLERRKYAAIDALLALEELVGLALSNRPVAGERKPTHAKVAYVVFVADRFPSPGDPLIELPGTLGARVEAAGRPELISPEAHGLRIDYREDDGLAERAVASLRLLISHPWRCLRDLLRRRPEEASLTALAPAVRRLQRDRGARVQPLGGGEAQAVARRLEALAGRRGR